MADRRGPGRWEAVCYLISSHFETLMQACVNTLAATTLPLGSVVRLKMSNDMKMISMVMTKALKQPWL